MELFLIVLLAAGVSYMAMQTQPTTKQKPASLEEFEFPQADEGTPQAVTFGDCWTEDWMVLGVGNYRAEAIRTSSGK